jgi:hypothetical protein
MHSSHLEGRRDDGFDSIQIQSSGSTQQFAKTGLFAYYSECGFGAYGPGKDVLDEISREETRNGRPDITFVLRSETTGYPSQIGFKSAKPPDDTQKVQARTEAQRLIDAYALAGTRNPYG